MKIAAVALVLAALSLPSSASTSTTGLVRILGVTTGRATVDEGAKGWSAGDSSYIGLSLRTTSGKPIGYGAMTCEAMGRTLPGRVSVCRAVYVLPLGKLVLAGTRQRADFYTLAVVGGSGVYSRAAGTLVASLVREGMPHRYRLLVSLEE